MAFVAAEVVPLFLITLFTIIAYDLKASSYVIWVIVSQFIAIAVVAPLVGTLSDLLGRRIVILVGLACTVVAMILLGTVQNITGILAGQVMAGVGIGIQLLTTVAAATELVPTSKRGATIGYIVCGFLPFAAASLWAISRLPQLAMGRFTGRHLGDYCFRRPCCLLSSSTSS
jgi:MFS family permease